LVSGIVALQVVWGGDVYFFQTHAMAKSPIKKVVDILSSGFTRDYEERFKVQTRYQAIGAAVPKGSRILFHEHNMHLGVGTESLLDKHQWQLGLDYAHAGSPEGVRKLLVSVGATHVYFIPGRSDTIDTLAGDIIFHEFVTNHATDSRRVGGGTLVTVPKEPSSRLFRDRAVVLSCGRAPFPGLYELSALAVPPYGPDKDRFGRAERTGSDLESALSWLPEVDFVVLDTGCAKRPPEELLGDFEQLFERKVHSVWRRKLPRERLPARQRRAPVAPEESHDDAEAEEQ
jgi:hypothetical protein